MIKLTTPQIFTADFTDHGTLGRTITSFGQCATCDMFNIGSEEK